MITNIITGQPYNQNGSGKPIGDTKASGTFTDHQGRLFLIDYDNGIIPLNDNEFKFPSMPENVLEVSGMSLWNLALEFHTGRIFEPLLGGFYVLLVPLTGLTAITVVLSGYLLWRKRSRIKRKNLIEKNIKQIDAMKTKTFMSEPLKDNPHGVDVRQLYDDPSAQIMHINLNPGESLKPHKTPVDAVFYVLEGEPTVHINGESISQVKDTLIESPAYVPHHISNESEETARILVIKAPRPENKSKLL